MITNILDEKELNKYITKDSQLIIKCPTVPKNTLHHRMLIVAFILLFSSILVFGVALYLIQADISSIKAKYGGFAPWEVANNKFDAQMMQGHIDTLYYNQDKREETIILNGMMIAAILLVVLIFFARSKRIIIGGKSGVMISPFLPKKFSWSDFTDISTTKNGVIVLSLSDRFGLLKRKIYIDTQKDNQIISTFLKGKIKSKKK